MRRPLQTTRTTRVAEALRVGVEHEIAAELAAAAGGPGAPIVAEPTLRARLRNPPEIQAPAETERPTLARVRPHQHRSLQGRVRRCREFRVRDEAQEWGVAHLV